MTESMIRAFARFTQEASIDALPDDVRRESQRILLDSLGCAVAGHAVPKGEIGVRYGRTLGAGSTDATIIGSEHRSSIFGAAFANGELINALDMDAVLPPGHVTPYTLPGALAVAEQLDRSGADLLTAIAVSHEMSYRLGKAVDYVRDTKPDGTVGLADVIGYSLTVFGATAAISALKNYDVDVTADALGLAGITAPVNSQRAWFAHAPSSTIKYLLAGGLTQTALTAAHLAEYGHRGDDQVLDDADYGFRRFIGTKRWKTDGVLDGLGTTWRFPAEASYKPYPHCRILHAPLDALIDIVETNGLTPDRIESIRVFGEAWVFQPVWMNNDISELHDAQFSIAHGLAVGAHNVSPRRDWLDPELVFGTSVADLMKRVQYEPHPDWARNLGAHPSARPTRVEVVADGQTYVAERSFPKGSPSPEPQTVMTDDEVAAKFRDNVSDLIEPARADEIVSAVFGLEEAPSIRGLLRACTGDASAQL